jgi:hypothetical protein
MLFSRLSTIYGDIFIDKNDTVNYKLNDESYHINDLIKINDIVYFKVNYEDKWFMSNGSEIIKELNYSTITKKSSVLIAVKNNKYSILSLNGDILMENLNWADNNTFGTAIKKGNERKIEIIKNNEITIISGYDYAIPCSNKHFICWNVNGLIPAWYLLNSEFKVIETSTRKIIEFANTFFLRKGEKILMVNNTGKVVESEEYGDFFSGDECLYMFNKINNKWEIFNNNFNKVLSLDYSYIPITATISDMLIIKNERNGNIMLLDINNKTSQVINSFIIIDKYLFIRRGLLWNIYY